MSGDSILKNYFSLVPDRQCGECMVCCEYMPISTPGLVKPAEVLCHHCVVNKGCSNYEARPNVCRTWHCLWRRDAAMPDELRPDRSGMIFSLIVHEDPHYVFENAHITCIAMKSRSDHRQPLAAAAIARYISQGVLPVWLGYGGGKDLVWPDTELADAIVNPYTTPHKHLIPQGREWLEKYESLIEPLQAADAKFGSGFVDI